MVLKRKTSKKAGTAKRTTHKKTITRQTAGTKLFRIVLMHKQGPYGSVQQCNTRKAFVKHHVPHVKFTAVKKTGKGYTFSTSASYRERFPANVTAAMIKSHIEHRDPTSKVSVTAS